MSRTSNFLAEISRLKDENRKLEDIVTRLTEYIRELRRQSGQRPHDWEPCRPGLEDVD